MSRKFGSREVNSLFRGGVTADREEKIEVGVLIFRLSRMRLLAFLVT